MAEITTQALEKASRDSLEQWDEFRNRVMALQNKAEASNDSELRQKVYELIIGLHLEQALERARKIQPR